MMMMMMMMLCLPRFNTAESKILENAARKRKDTSFRALKAGCLSCDVAEVFPQSPGACVSGSLLN